MRTYKQILRELEYCEKIAAAENLGPSIDNDGNVVLTPAQRRAVHARRAERLRKEKADFERFLENAGFR